MEPGSLQLSLVWDGAQIVAASVVSTRPPVDRALCGLPAASLLEVVPRLFSLCRQAQGAAAALCLQAARSQPMEIDSRLSLALGIAVETIAEHLYHLMIAWPQMIGETLRDNAAKELASWRRRLAGAVEETVTATLGADLSTWLEEVSLPQFDDFPTVDAAVLLPQFSAAEWARQIDGADFPDPPTLAGEPAETGVLARHAADAEVGGLLCARRRVRARLLARHVDLRYLAQALTDRSRLAALVDAATVAEGRGLARVETARGTLLHRVELDGERVGAYQIVAPTDWNFHPQGAFVHEIIGCPVTSHDDALMAAGRLALSLDPCVPCSWRVDDA